MSTSNSTGALLLLALCLVVKVEMDEPSDMAAAATSSAATRSVVQPAFAWGWRVPQIFHRAARHNIAIIIDSTASMLMVDKRCGKPKLPCALAGIQTLLRRLRPCRTKTESCAPWQEDALDAVSVFTFPNIASETVATEYDCSAVRPRVLPYSFPPSGKDGPSSTHVPEGPSQPEPGAGLTLGALHPTYQIVAFSSDYKASGNSNGLNPASDLVRALGGVADCPGVKAPGGTSTYFAGAIYAAQASLAAQRQARPGSSNVLILIGDGDANASRFQLQIATDSGAYPSWINECNQAVASALEASIEGTRVYSVSYGSSSMGCPTDRPDSGLTSPCRVMQTIASSPQTFFTVGEQEAGCPMSPHRESDMQGVFIQIAKSIQRDRGSPGHK